MSSYIVVNYVVKVSWRRHPSKLWSDRYS